MQHIIKNKKIFPILIILLISLFFEIFIFNFGYFRTKFSKEQSTFLSYTVEKINDNTIIKISDVNARITSLKIDVNNDNKPLTYAVRYTLEDYNVYTSIPEKTSFDNSTCFLFDTKSKCKNLEISISSYENLQIGQIIINEPIFNFKLSRLFLLYLIFVIVYLIKFTNFENLNFISKSDVLNKQNKALLTLYKMQNIITICLISLFVLVFYIYVNNQNSFMSIKPDALFEETNMITEPAMSADALMHNNGKLDAVPSEELNNLENPYDTGIREGNHINYLYDTAFYNKSYYSYFGIAPIISMVIPIKLITGNYYPSSVYNTIFMMLTIIVGYYVYKKLVEKFVKRDIKLYLYYLGYFAIILGSNFLTLMRGMKYDLVISSGIFYILSSIAILLSLESRVLKEKKHSKIDILLYILLGLCLGLIVLSKPTYILYYALLLGFAVPYLLKLSKSQKIQALICTSVPLIILAIFQMWYNKVRFESIFEFGAKYQLTSYNMSVLMGFSFVKIFEGLLKYIFTLPNLNSTAFPFFTIQNGINMDLMGELVYQTRIVGLVSIPILWILLFKKNILNCKSNKHSKNDKTEISNIDKTNHHLNIIINIIIVVALLLIILNSCMGGIGENYITDVKFMLCLFAIILWFNYIGTEKENTISIEKNPKEKALANDFDSVALNNATIKNKAFILIMIITILIYIPISFSGEQNYLLDNSLMLTIKLKNMFQFWL